ncbi:tetratricopeptide repeat protein [Breznakiella homolactica]|uniref:Tetratricopeptide repeat protein n=1 Tax=Breznakiella homolactica TaxID=2798577 RepID=A0A7T7XJK7_9SPIR|nr:tetratricopeptide repeat protein [Breznakiella homolactica]QQO07556.1 tetratricopeptide repeat protein [Breznakiella homolactica]
MKIRRSWFLLCLLAAAPVVYAQVRPDALQEYRSGNFQRAVAICTDEIRENPNNLDSHVVMCWSLIRLGRYEEAERYGRAGRIISRYDPRIIEILGEANYFQGRNSEALQLFQEYINLSPEGGRIDTVYYYMGEIYIRLGRFRHADISLSTAVHYLPGQADWWTRLAYARENAGELDSAVAAYERALSLNSQLSDARRGLERTRRALASR